MKYLPVALFLLLLTACSAPAPVDPYAARAAGQAAQIYADAALVATQSERLARVEQATLEAAKVQLRTTETAAAVAIRSTEMAANTQATQTVSSVLLLEAKATEAAEDKHATQTAVVQTTATAWIVTQTAAWPTRQAIIAQVDVARARAGKAANLQVAWPAAVFFIGLAIAAGLFISMLKIVDLVVARWQRKIVMFDNPFGLWYVPDPNSTPLLIAQRGRRPLLPAQSGPDFERVTPTQWRRVEPDDPPSLPSGTTAQTIEYLQDAADLVGEDAQQLPGWRDMPGWTSEKVQRVVAALKAAGLIYTRPGVGTYISDQYGDLRKVLYAVETHQVKIRPTPPGGDAG